MTTSYSKSKFYRIEDSSIIFVILFLDNGNYSGEISWGFDATKTHYSNHNKIEGTIFQTQIIGEKKTEQEVFDEITGLLKSVNPDFNESKIVLI